MTSSYAKVRTAMAPKLAEQSTQSLCAALGMFDGCELDEVERIVQAVICDELCRRYPAADEALGLWAEDLETSETANVVVIRAALAAAA